MTSKLKEVVDMKEKGSKRKGDKNWYKIGFVSFIVAIVLVAGFFGFRALQSNAFQQGVQRGVVTAQSNVVQRINTKGEIPLVVGQGENQSVQWTSMGQVCTAIAQQQQQLAQQGATPQTTQAEQATSQ
ncbi:MAG: hypothetical protein ABEI74_03710 [Candidatus Pacearchaeota archaeon]